MALVAAALTLKTSSGQQAALWFEFRPFRIFRGGLSESQNPGMEQCIQNCLNCHHVCYEMAMNHCLENGGKHTEPKHFRLMTTCAEICQTSAHFMLSGSELHELTCGVCAQVCESCAHDCEAVGDMVERP